MAGLHTLVRGSRFAGLARELRRVTWPRWRVLNDEDGRFMNRILAYHLREESSCIDVGCHAGAILEQMVRLAPRGRHWAFAPLPHLAAALPRRFPDVAVHEVVLADREGEAEFHHVVTNPGFSGLRRRTYDRPGEQVELIRVRTARLDDVVPLERQVDLVKIDVEGAELQVLEGGTRLIRRWRPLVLFEHGPGGSDHYGTTPGMVHRFLTDRGLDVFGLHGERPYAEEELAKIYAEGTRWNFLARPYRARPTSA